MEIDALRDPEVRKNVTIAELAQGIKQLAIACRDEDGEAGERFIASALCTARLRYPECQDEDILRVQKIAQNYATQVRELNAPRKR